MKNWHGLMKITEFKHFSKQGEILYQENDIKNILHVGGEDFVLKVLFAGKALPTNYYLGLDSRSSLEFSTTLSNLSGQEPSISGYQRQGVLSTSFSITDLSNGHKQANSPIVLFKAVGGSWGPVKNIFLANSLGYDSSSYLISSASLGNSITVSEGEIVTMKMAMLLSSC